MCVCVCVSILLLPAFVDILIPPPVQQIVKITLLQKKTCKKGQPDDISDLDVVTDQIDQLWRNLQES